MSPSYSNFGEYVKHHHSRYLDKADGLKPRLAPLITEQKNPIKIIEDEGILSKYEIIKILDLGGGSQGTVYLAKLKFCKAYDSEPKFAALKVTRLNDADSKMNSRERLIFEELNDRPLCPYIV